eukprot:2786718-Amphidinium_carterae.1
MHGLAECLQDFVAAGEHATQFGNVLLFFWGHTSRDLLQFLCAWYLFVANLHVVSRAASRILCSFCNRVPQRAPKIRRGPVEETTTCRECKVNCESCVSFAPFNTTSLSLLHDTWCEGQPETPWLSKDFLANTSMEYCFAPAVRAEKVRREVTC